jgi:hypothetical protein
MEMPPKNRKRALKPEQVALLRAWWIDADPRRGRGLRAALNSGTTRRKKLDPAEIAKIPPAGGNARSIFVERCG